MAKVKPSSKNHKWIEIKQFGSLQLPETVFSALLLAPEPFLQEMRMAAAIEDDLLYPR